MNILKDQIVNSINGETLTQHVGSLVSMKKRDRKAILSCFYQASRGLL